MRWLRARESERKSNNRAQEHKSIRRGRCDVERNCSKNFATFQKGSCRIGGTLRAMKRAEQGCWPFTFAACVVWLGFDGCKVSLDVRLELRRRTERTAWKTTNATTQCDEYFPKRCEPRSAETRAGAHPLGLLFVFRCRRDKAAEKVDSPHPDIGHGNWRTPVCSVTC